MFFGCDVRFAYLLKKLNGTAVIVYRGSQGSALFRPGMRRRMPAGDLTIK